MSNTPPRDPQDRSVDWERNDNSMRKLTEEEKDTIAYPEVVSEQPFSVLPPVAGAVPKDQRIEQLELQNKKLRLQLLDDQKEKEKNDLENQSATAKFSTLASTSTPKPNEEGVPPPVALAPDSERILIQNPNKIVPQITETAKQDQQKVPKKLSDAKKPSPSEEKKQPIPSKEVQIQQPAPVTIEIKKYNGVCILNVCFFISLLVCAVIGSITMYIGDHVLYVTDNDLIQVNEATSIITDALGSWNSNLATEISIIDSDKNCPQGWEHLFQTQWKGMTKGCVYNNQIMSLSYYTSIRASELKYCSSRGHQKGQAPKNCAAQYECKDVLASVGAVNQNIFAEKKICVHKNGPKLVDTPISIEDGKLDGCPINYTACTNKTKNWWDRFCVKDLSQCPILAIEFQRVEDAEDGKFQNSEEWITLPFTESLNLIYTKTDSPGRPITKTFVGKAPCTNPSQITSFGYQLPLEAQKVDLSCFLEQDGLPAYDPRYTELQNFSANQYDIQNASGVLAILQKQRGFGQSVPDINVKKNQEYKFFTRPSIEWKCSLSQMEEAIAIMKEPKAIVPTHRKYGRTVWWLVFTHFCVFWIPVFFVWCCRKKTGQQDLYLAICSILAFELLLMIGVFISTDHDVKQRFEERADQLLELKQATEGCMDVYSQISDELFAEKITEPIEDVDESAVWYNIFAAIVMTQVCTMCCLCCAIVTCCQKSCRGPNIWQKSGML